MGHLAGRLAGWGLWLGRLLPLGWLPRLGRPRAVAMATHHAAVRAYGNQAARRNLRDQEADVFRRATGGLRAAKGDAALQGRAVADNIRLWLMLGDVLRDPANALPAELRAGIVSVGHAVQREMARPDPDLDFLILVNESITAGLAGAT